MVSNDYPSLDTSKFQSFIDEANTNPNSFDEMIAASAKHMIIPEDTNEYIPLNIINYSPVFPLIPPIINYELFEKFDDSTLMFIFFYQNNNTAKIYAGKNLSKRGWMFNKKYSTFLEPQKPMKNITEEYLEGKFKFWDFEKDWGFGVKKDFKFELKHLEKFEYN